MKNKSLLILFLTAMVVFTSCNKEKRYSNKLMKGEVWKVNYIRVDSEPIEFYGEWLIESDVSIYDSVPTLEWKQDNLDAFFEWQFQNNGKNFQLNYNLLCSEADGTLLDTLDYIGNDITGTYEVERHGKNKMLFNSTNTAGFANKQISIFIERVR